ncbi:HD domain-containing protein [Candidatus Bathyarchaeota archaeon]|nr:HD domain-containing protein [Candidatus Bathyarchaeota archaeon]
MVIPLIESIFKLKMLPRHGWLEHDVPRARVESVASHSYGTAILLVILDLLDLIPPHLSLEKLLKIALLHDLAESETGDVTPRSGVTPEEKSQAERDAFSRIFHGDSRFNILNEMGSLFAGLDEPGPPCNRKPDEYQFFKQVDKLDMMIQAIMYEREFDMNLKEFHEPVEKYLHGDALKRFFKEIKENL